MDPVRSRVGDIREETTGQLSLQVEIPLFEVPGLVTAVIGAVKGGCVRKKGGDIRLRISTGRRDESGTGAKWSRIETGKGVPQASGTRQSAGVHVEGGIRTQALIIAGKELGSGIVESVVIGIPLERKIVWNKEDAVAASDHGLGGERISKSQTRREFTLGKGHGGSAAIGPGFNQEEVAGTSAAWRSVTTGDCCIGSSGVKIFEPIEALA